MLSIAVFLFLFKDYRCYEILPVVNISGLARSPINDGRMPDFFDWRDLKMVSPVKDQRNCNACWAFSTIASIESHIKIYSNKEELLSEQFLIDCDEKKKGCGAAPILQTFADIVTKLGGVLREREYYPYNEKLNYCRWKSPTLYDPYFYSSFFYHPKPVPVVGFRRVWPDEDVMAEYLYKYGPLAAAINSASMATYKGGIDEPTEQTCSSDPEHLDHAVLIVGYNYHESKSGKKTPYWIIKNSWGTDWGDDGFYYLVRGRNACGITSDVSFPFVN